jgi:hypothetical protein
MGILSASLPDAHGAFEILRCGRHAIDRVTAGSLDQEAYTPKPQDGNAK